VTGSLGRLVRASALAAVPLFAACSGGSGGTSAPPAAGVTAGVTAEELMREVRVLAHDSMEGRRIGTPGGARARRYLAGAFERTGLERFGERFDHPFSVPGGPDSTMLGGGNVIGIVRGTASPERYIVVSAHYDHLGVRDGVVFNGADDNASGTSALLAMARQLVRARPAHSVIFVALDGEEGPGAGVRTFIANPPVPLAAIALNVNLDMVGRNDANVLWAAGAHHYPFLRPYLDSVAARAPLTLKQGHDRPNVASEQDWTFSSDHGAFHRSGIPFVYFGEEDHPDYHKPTDDPEGIIPAFHVSAVTTVLDAIRTFDRNLGAIAAARAATPAARPAPGGS
jgi:hypothetical protein